MAASSLSRVQIPWRWRFLIYGAIWVVAASILATRAELYLDDDNTETSTRWMVFAMAPVSAAMGLDFATLTVFHWATNQVGVLTWLFLVGFVAHALFTFSCIRRRSFVALVSMLVVTLSIAVFYALQFYHLDATTGHG